MVGHLFFELALEVLACVLGVLGNQIYDFFGKEHLLQEISQRRVADQRGDLVLLRNQHILFADFYQFFPDNRPQLFAQPVYVFASYRQIFSGQTPDQLLLNYPNVVDNLLSRKLNQTKHVVDILQLQPLKVDCVVLVFILHALFDILKDLGEISGTKSTKSAKHFDSYLFSCT